MIEYKMIDYHYEARFKYFLHSFLDFTDLVSSGLSRSPMQHICILIHLQRKGKENIYWY